MIRNSRLTGSQASAKDQQQIQECEKDMLKLYAYRSEVVRSCQNIIPVLEYYMAHLISSLGKYLTKMEHFTYFFLHS